MAGEGGLPQLLPLPAHLERRAGQALLPPAGRIALLGGLPPEGESAPLLFWVDQLRTDLAAAGAVSWRVSPSRAEGGEAENEDGRAGFENEGGAPGIVLACDASLPDHSYRLAVRRRAPFCALSAADGASLRDGIQTLRQLVRGSGLALPCCEIRDMPALAIRGFSLDVSRGRVPHLATLREILDVLELLKFTQLQLYVESAVAFPRTVEAWRGSSPLAFDDIRRVGDMCRLRGIEFVPSLASFGHMYDILRTPRWRGLGEHPEQAGRPFSLVERMRHHTLNPANPRSLAFAERQVDDYLPLFSSPLFNIGGDETFDLGTGASAPLARKVGVPRLYASFVGKLCAHLVDRGRTPIVYADIALKYPRLLPALPKGIIFANWDYAAHPNLGNVSRVAQSGHRQLVCPGTETWNRLLPDTDAAWSNISKLCKTGRENGADGVLLTDWGDYGHINDPTMSLPGLAFAAECAWRTIPRPRRKVGDATSRILFGDTTGSLVSLLGQASREQRFGWGYAVLWWELGEGRRANRDVLAALGMPETLHDDPAAARRGFSATRCPTLQETETADERLRDLAGKLSALAIRSVARPSLQPGFLTAVPPAVLAVDGQILLNDLGCALGGRLPGRKQGTLSRRLNIWSLAFKHRWMAVSRPSRIGDILRILWGYADLAEEGTLASA